MDSAKIIRYQNNTAGYTEFSINVSHLGKNWLTKKRFSDFTALDAALKSSGVIVGAELPQKNWFSKFDVDFLVKRAKALQLYLDRIIAINPVPSLIKEFLEVEKNMLEADLKSHKSVRQIRKSDKITAIVNKAKNKFIVLDTKARIDMTLRREFQDKFPSGLVATPARRTKGTASSFNSDGSFKRGTGGSGSFSSPKGSFSAGGSEDAPGSRVSTRRHAESIRLAMQTAEYRTFVEKRMRDCFSRQNYLHSYLIYDEFMSMTTIFPADTSDILSILSAPIPNESLSGEHAMDSCAMAVEAVRQSLLVSPGAGPVDSIGAEPMIADRLLFTDPPPPSPTRQFARPVPRNPSETDGSGLLIRRTTQDSGSNRPPGSYRPAPAYDI